MTSAGRFGRRAVLVVASAALLLPAVAGCSQEPKVIRPYTQADGTNASNDIVKLNDIVLVQQDGQARLSGLAVASADDEITGVTGHALNADNAISASLAPSTTRVPLAANTAVSLADAGVQVSSPGLTDGLLASITITFSHAEPITLQAPVIAATQPDYTPVAPTPSAP